MAYADFLIAPRDLHTHLDDPRWRIVDCRFELAQPEQGREDYLSAHIPGAVYAHLDRDLAAPVTPSSGRHPLPQPAAFAATLGRWGIAPDTAVVVYDQGGGAIAARLWWMLRWLGHGTVLMLDGGFEAWRRAGLETSTDIPAIEPTTYPASADDSMIVNTAELPGLLERGELLVDAREAERYAGLKEPIDAVAGHVPGARNFPFRKSLREDGTWRSEEELERAWAALLGGGPGRAWITMCGSGVTACHLAVSAELAGFRAPRLYVGSFSEWIRDRRRPVAGGPAEGGAGGAAEPP
jgi:thiosulfate/3-mercaptopyruvate sulfurtransferase